MPNGWLLNAVCAVGNFEEVMKRVFILDPDSRSRLNYHYADGGTFIANPPSWVM